MVLYASYNFTMSVIADLGEVVKAKFDFDVVGHYSRPDVLSLVVRDQPYNSVTFASGGI